MILQELCLKPFAGFRDRALVFEPGLNVVLGPNDAGKSSIFRAIDCGLFLGSRVSRSTKEGRELLPRILPIEGDHANLELRFRVKEREGRLKKTWGSGAGVRLEIGGKGELNSEEEVEEELRALLPAPVATMQKVFFMGQNALEGTVAELARSQDSLHSLGDLLRVAVDQTGGVSVERLKRLLEERLGNAFRYWDRTAGLPEKGRGIEDPWKKNIGSILSAYYAKEVARRDCSQARALENRRDIVLQSLREKESRREILREFVRTNSAFVESASARQLLEEKIATAKGDGESMGRDLKAWIQAESDRRIFAPEVERLEQARKALEEEMRLSLASAKKRELAARLIKVREARAAHLEAQAKLSGLPALRAEDLKRVRGAQQEVDSLRAGLKAGKIQVQFVAKREFEVAFRKDLEQERKETMAAGKSMTVNAGGRIQLHTDLFDLAVTSGEGNLQELEQEYAARIDHLGKLFAQMGVANLEEAQSRHEQWLEAANGVRSAESALRALLGSDKLEDLERLESQSGASASTKQAREPEMVQVELAHLTKELGPKKDGLVGCTRLIEDLGRRYGFSESEKLMDRMVQGKAALPLHEAKLSELPPLPESIGRLEEFLPRFRQAKAELDLLGEDIGRFGIQMAEINAQLPAESAEDLEREARDLEAAFARELARGKALLRVEAAIQAVEAQAGDVFRGFQEEFANLVAKLSLGKYKNARMDASLPTDFLRSDGAHIPYGWLSAGTKDCFALGLRLAMARHFMGAKDGFLLIDDPLVAMDPDRQEVAAKMLKEFAATSQVIIFTCHPAHAELSGGNRIELQPS